MTYFQKFLNNIHTKIPQSQVEYTKFVLKTILDTYKINDSSFEFSYSDHYEICIKYSTDDGFLRTLFISDDVLDSYCIIFYGSFPITTRLWHMESCKREVLPLIDIFINYKD